MTVLYVMKISAAKMEKCIIYSTRKTDMTSPKWVSAFNSLILLHCVSVILLFLSIPQSLADKWHMSYISPTRGHYPPVFCKVTNVVLDPKNRVFKYKPDTSSKHDFDAACGASGGIWAVAPDTVSDSMDCSESFDEGYVFTMYFYYSGSNYFHLHYDMMIPLFSLFQNLDESRKIVLMPSVETSRLQSVYWDTVAFKDPTKYWYQMLQVLSSSHSLQPLDTSLQQDRGNICFKKLHFGTPSFSLDDKDLVLKYIHFIKSRLNVKHELLSTRKVGIIKRTSRRKILNERELVEAVSVFADVELVEFSGLSFEQQVEEVQKYAVLVGMNGAGLMNALFLSPGAVAIQLVPYLADLNFKEFARLLRNRGPYLEWHNEHAELTVERPHDPYHGQSDTTVHVQEFADLIKQAINLVNTDEYTSKTEL